MQNLLEKYRKKLKRYNEIKLNFFKLDKIERVDITARINEVESIISDIENLFFKQQREI